MIRQLPDCHHHFHLDCIDQWLATHTTCPMCRRSLLPPDPNTQPPVSPSGSPTAHLLPLWASSARSQQHQELAVELRPVSCPPPMSPLFDTLSDLVMYVLAACLTLYSTCRAVVAHQKSLQSIWPWLQPNIMHSALPMDDLIWCSWITIVGQMIPMKASRLRALPQHY